MNKKKWIAVALAATMTCALGVMTACGDNDDGGGDNSGYSMDITKQVSSWKKVTKNDATYYSAEGVVYCANPTTKAKQCLNIYIPSEYMNDDGSINTSGTCNGYTSTTAPILYINSVGAYMGKAPYKITQTSETLAMRNSWYYNYINQGYVLAFAGARGRDDYKGSTSEALGKAPIALADLKAGIRFLRHNAENLPGDTDKIISNGMSAGGAMSILVATSGNSTEFDSYLQAMGAVMDEKDDVYAAQVYCPITDLDHADMYYEWSYSNDNSAEWKKMTDFQKTLSANLKSEFVSYFNGLELNVGGTDYRLGTDGRSGTFYNWLLEQYAASAARETNAKAPTTIDGIKNRSKACPAFDMLDNSGAENGVFGSRSSLYSKDSVDWSRHFSVTTTEQIKALETSYATEYATYYNAYQTQSDLADVKEQVKLYNPYNYLNAQATDIASKIRICVGTQDSDTSPAVSATLALKLMSLGIDTEYNLVWGLGHTDADYANAFETWVDSISK